MLSALIAFPAMFAQVGVTVGVVHTKCKVPIWIVLLHLAPISCKVSFMFSNNMESWTLLKYTDMLLKVTGTDGFTNEVNTNNGKAKAFLDAFFPKPPQNSSILADYIYPDPLPDPPPITCEQLEAQICHLSPYKASSPDEIPNIVLQKSFNLIADYLLHIFQTVFTLQTYYKPWKHFTTIVPRKPGKPDYEIPKAYHPIALLCTMGKVLTVLIAEDMS